MSKWPRLDPDADRGLAKALSEGGEGALGELYDGYAERLRDYSGLLVRDKRLATDIVHDTLIDARRRSRRMRDQERLRAWLYAAVRRRSLQRNRHPSLRWDWGDEATGQPAGEPVDENVRELLETTFDRLDFLDQEVLLLALRHDLTGDDLGGLLGIPARRANARVVRARARADSALDKARQSLVRRCAAGERTEGSERTEPPGAGESLEADESESLEADEPLEADEFCEVDELFAPREVESGPDASALADHLTNCAACRRRVELSLGALVDLLPAPTLPASLRHRVIHTGTDPELAGYRADIVARGGTLNTDGLPRQPDIPSYFARRWLFTTGGMAGAAVTALVAAFLMGPGTSIPGLIWPGQPQPSITHTKPGRQPGGESSRQEQPPAGRGPGPPTDAAAQTGHTPGAKPTARPVGILTVTPDTVTLGPRENVAKLTLSVARTAMTWDATTSSSRITLSADHGKIAADDTAVVTVTFARALIELPGKATITITDSTGKHHVIAVSWGVSLL